VIEVTQLVVAKAAAAIAARPTRDAHPRAVHMRTHMIDVVTACGSGRGALVLSAAAVGAAQPGHALIVAVTERPDVEGLNARVGHWLTGVSLGGACIG
jgi:hypothetical protein